MKVIVFGNMAAGKTSIIERLRKKHKWPKIAIDDFRRTYGNGSMKGELLARRKFFEAVRKRGNQFIECSGVGKVGAGLFRSLRTSNEEVICLLLSCPKDICQSRIKGRKWDFPFPFPPSHAQSFIRRTNSLIRDGSIERKWSVRPNTHFVKFASSHTGDIQRIALHATKLISKTVQSPMH